MDVNKLNHQNNNDASNKNEDDCKEIILFEEENKTDEERRENTASDIEEISREEYYLECARYGEYDDLKKFIKECRDIDYKLDYDYRDIKKNTALRI